MSSAAASLPRRFASLVRIEHTVFALPFAYVGAFLAVDGFPGWGNLLWVTVAMVGARTLAMGLNRLIDAELDARNPRTATREIPSGLLTALPGLGSLRALRSRSTSSRCSSSIRSCAGCGRSPSLSSSSYPYLKRFTWLCHLWLGACTGLAPVGAWIAVTGSAPWEAWALFAAQGLWVAGFDLFYSLFDVDHDRAAGLHSWATRWGERGVFAGARAFHAARRGAARSRRRRAVASGSSTGSALLAVAACSSTSTRSCARATCADSMRRSSPSTA